MNAVQLVNETANSPPLARADWLTLALRVLEQDGVGALQITQLSKALGVTRGSFYWHFKSRNDLLNATLKEWDAINNAGFDTAFRNCTTLDESILRFFEMWTDAGLFRPPLDQAVRDWAQLDAGVLAKVRNADTARIASLADIFTRFDFAPEDASVRARILYFSQIGYTAMNLGEAMEERLSLLAQYFAAYTGRALDPAIASDFASRMKGTL